MSAMATTPVTGSIASAFRTWLGRIRRDLPGKAAGMAVAAGLLAVAQGVCAELPLIGMTAIESQGASPGDAGIVADRIRSELVRSGQVRLVERRAMDRVLKEQAFQASGAAGDADAARIGRLLAAESMLVPSLRCGREQCTLGARLVDVATGEIQVSVDQDGPGGLDALVTNSVPQLVERLLASSRSRPAGDGTGEIHVEVDDTEATLRLDGKPVRGRGSFALEKLAPGPHHLEARTRDRIARREIRLEPGQLLRADLELQPGTGRVLLLSRPLGAQVFSDRLLIGETPQRSIELPAGLRTLTFRKLGYLDTAVTLVVETDSMPRLHVQLSPAGTLAIGPPLAVQARLWQDGSPLIGDASEHIPLKVGRWHLKLEAPGYLPVDREIEIRHGRTTQIELERMP